MSDKMRVLNICAHDILEYNRIVLFNELGYSVMTTGVYTNPQKLKQTKPYLPESPYPIEKELLEEFFHLNPSGYTYGQTELKLSKSFIDKFDIILASWLYKPILTYHNLLSDKLVMCETLGQSTGHHEKLLSQVRAKGAKIIRMSDKESLFPRYAGADAVIDLEIDEDFYKGWTGEEESIVTVNAAFQTRGNDCRYNQYRQVVEGLPAELYGAKNENIPYTFSRGAATREQILERYQKCRVGFASVSPPCPCTLSPKEMLATGMPVVTYGPGIGGMTLSVHEFLKDGAGFYSDDIGELREYIRQLLNDYDLAKEMSKKAREVAVKSFGKEVIKQKWEEFIDSHA